MNSNALRPISVIWLLIVSISVLFVSLAGIRTVASAQGTKPTSTPSATATNTPTIIHTDSLDVFVTPHTPTKDPQQIHITSRQDGILVDGKVTVQGKTAVSGFSYYEVEFSYYPNPTQTWFLLKRSDLPVNDGELAEWDEVCLTHWI